MTADSQAVSQEFFEQLTDKYRQATLVAGELEYRFEIAGCRIALRLAGPALERMMTFALAHLRSSFVGEPDLTILAADSGSTGIPQPAVAWTHYIDLFTDTDATQGEIQGFNEGAFSLIHNISFRQIHMLNRARQTALIWFDDANAQPYWETAFPLRTVLHLWTRDMPIQLIHSAAVGIPDGGILLMGRSGSGKSTTTLACLSAENGLLFAGDDYVAVRVDSTPYIHSLYQVAKIESNNVSRFPHLAECIVNLTRQTGEKAIIPMLDVYPQAVTAGFPLRAIVIPHITGRPDSRIVLGSRAQALWALAPTTLFQLIAAKQITFDKLRQVVRLVPVYTLEAGTDLDQLPQVIKAFLLNGCVA